jgi:hypothetical protein
MKKLFKSLKKAFSLFLKTCSSCQQNLPTLSYIIYKLFHTSTGIFVGIGIGVFIALKISYLMGNTNIGKITGLTVGAFVEFFATFIFELRHLKYLKYRKRYIAMISGIGVVVGIIVSLYYSILLGALVEGSFIFFLYVFLDYNKNKRYIHIQVHKKIRGRKKKTNINKKTKNMQSKKKGEL